MKLGGLDGDRASSGSPKVWGLEFGGLCAVAGLSSLFGTTDFHVRSSGGSHGCSKGWGVYTEVVRWVRGGLLNRNDCVVSRSCDLFGFRKDGIVHAGDGCGGGNGGYGVC